MKTITSFLLTFCIAGSISGQQLHKISAAEAAGAHQASPEAIKKIKEFRANKSKARAITATTINEQNDPTDAILAGPHAAIMQYYVNPIFCDSTVTTKYGTSAATHVITQKVGGMFDPKSTLYPAASVLPTWESYTIDTVWIAGAYHIKTTAANAKDTLQVELSWGYDTSSFYAAVSIPTPAEKWRLPKSGVSLLAGNKSLSTSPASNSVKLRHVLTTADTITVGAAGANWPYIPIVLTTPLQVPANAIVGIQYTYVNKSAVPSNKVYYVSPTNTATMNSYEAFLSADTSGVAHNYFYDSTSWGTSSTLYNSERYGTHTGTTAFLNGDMVPETEQGYVWFFSYSHTPLITAVKELSSATAGMVLYQNVPNPFNGTSTINYDLPVSSGATLTICDLTGRTVSINQLGTMDAGMHSLILNSSEYSKGIYFYTLKANGISVSKKMVISE